jgi:RNA recognition motif-containing protein
MSLFIGNVSKKVTQQEFEEAFKSFGNCKIDLRVPSKPPRNVMHSCSSRVRDAENRRDWRSKTPTSAAFALISSGQRTQDGLMKIKVRKMIAFAGGEATLAKEVGAKRTVSSAAHPPSKNAMHQHTRTTMTISRLSSQSHQETLSTYA